MRRTICMLIAALLAASGLSLAALAWGRGLGALSGGGCALADGLHHAVVVIEHGDQWTPPNAALARCVAFTGNGITGEQALHDSGLQYSAQNYSGNGDAVCQVDSEPRGYSSCFQDGRFWALFQSRSSAQGRWFYSSQGISALSLNDGDAVGLRYQAQSSSLPPPSPLGTCPAPPPAPATTHPGPPATPPAAHIATPRSSPAPSAPPGAGPVVTASPSASPAVSGPAAPGSASAASPSAGRAGSAAVTPSPPSPPARSGAPLAPLLAGGGGAGLIALLVLRTVKGRRR